MIILSIIIIANIHQTFLLCVLQSAGFDCGVPLLWVLSLHSAKLSVQFVAAPFKNVLPGMPRWLGRLVPCKLDDLNSIPRTHFKVEGDSQLHNLVL